MDSKATQEDSAAINGRSMDHGNDDLEEGLKNVVNEGNTMDFAKMVAKQTNNVASNGANSKKGYGKDSSGHASKTKTTAETTDAEIEEVADVNDTEEF